MNKYEIDYEVYVPEWGTITGLQFETEDEARDEVQDRLIKAYPESSSIEITEVRKV